MMMYEGRDPSHNNATGDVQRVVVTRPRLLTTAEAADFLRLRESTLRDYGRRGIVPCVHIGRHVRYVEADIIAWLEGMRSGLGSV